MTQDQLKDPNFANKAIESSLIVWHPAPFTFHLPKPVVLPPPVLLPEEAPIPQEVAMVPFQPSISSSPTMRDLGSSLAKRVFEFASFLVPKSFGGSSSGESSGEGSSSKKQKK